MASISNRVSEGCLDELPSMDSSIIRVFSSSTFTDMTEERNYLMKKSIPKIRNFCFMKGLTFQLVDMRWGVRDEASIDHTTNEVVLNEVEKSKMISRGPYMLALLGDKYGSRPMPSKIEAGEYKLIRRTAMKLGYDTSLMDQWFKRDDNAEPAIFYLIPITKLLPNYDNDLEGFEQQRQNDREKWTNIDAKLTTMLRGAANQAYEEGLIDKATRHKYFYSVTEVEIQSGILEPESVKDKVICYCRSFLDLNIKDKLAWRYTDLIDGTVDDEAMELRERLKYTQVIPKLGPEEMKKYSLYWTPSGVDTSNPDHMNYLDDMCEDFEKKMMSMIDKALKKNDNKHFGINEKMYLEILLHLHFARHKSQVFCGRDALLETVRQKMLVTHTIPDVEDEKDEENKDSEESDTSSTASLYPAMNGQISKKDLDALKQIQAEHQEIKERLKQLGIIYNHADLDLDHENDPSRNPKAEMIRLPEMKTYCRPVVIYGNSGSGKTSVMAKIAELSKTWFPNSVQVVRFLGTSAHSSSIRDVLLGICLQIWMLYKVKPPINLDLETDFHFLTQYMIALLWKIKTKDRPLIILLDSVDQLQLTDHASSMHWLPLKVPPGVHIVVSTIPHCNNCLDNLRSLLPSHDCIVHVTSLSQETAEKIIKNTLKGKSRRLTKLQWRHLLDKTSKVGQPLYVKLLADQAVTWKSSTAMSKTAVGNSIKEAIVRLFESVEKEHGEIIITHLYGYLCAARDGLSLTELEDILSLDDEVLQDTFLYHLPPDPENIRFPSAVLTRALFGILDYLVERRSGMTTVLSWYHRQFTEVATERYLFKDRAVKIHALLADYFQGVWYKKRKALKLYKKKTASYPNAVRSVPEQPTLYCLNMYNTRKLIELPYQLVKCHRYQGFRDIIACDFSFLYAKCKTLGVTDVIEDLSLCLVAMDTDGFLDEEIYNDIKFVHEVLLMGVNMIRKDTNNLPIQLMARLGGIVQTKWLTSLIKGAQEWCETTSTPLLSPRSFCMPPPGAVLRVTIDIEVVLTENSRERDLGHLMYLHEDVNHLFVLTPPTSRFDNAFIHMFDLADNGSRVFMTKMTRNFMAISFLAANKYMHVKDTRGHDQIFQSKSATPMKLPHEAHCITASSSGKYLVYSSVSKVYVCITDTRGGVKIKHVLDSDQREKEVSNPDEDKEDKGTKNPFSKKTTDEVVNLIISPDEKFLAVYNTVYGYYKVWNLEKGQFLFDAKDPDAKEEMVKFSFSSSEYNDIGNASMITNSNILIYRKDGYRFQGQLGLFDLETGNFLYTLDSGSDYKLTLLSLHPTQRYIAVATSVTICSSGNNGKEWKIWDVGNGDMVTKATVPELFNNSWGMNCLKLFGSDKLFVASSQHGTNGAIYISYCGSVDTPTSSAIPFCSLNSHTMDVVQIIVSSDMKQLISASKDNCVKTWDLNKVLTKFNTATEGSCDDEEIASKLIPMFKEELKQTVTTNAIGVSSDAREIYQALSSGEMMIKDLKSNKVKDRVTMTSVPLTVLLVGSAGDLVVAAANEGNIEIWAIKTKAIHKSLKCKHKINCSAEGSDVLVAGQAGMEAKGSIWNIRTGDLLRELSLLYSFYTVAINASGTKFVSSMFDFPVVVCVTENAEPQMMDMKKVDTDMAAAQCTAVSPDETLALCGSVDGSIRVIEMTGAYKFRLGQKSTVVTAIFSPDSQSIVSGGYKSIYIWNMSDGSLKFKVRKHDNFVLNIRFDHRGTHFVTTGRDKRIVIWDFRRGISLTTFYADSQVDRVVFTRRGYVVFVPEGVSGAASLKPNPVLKQMLKGKYNLNIGATITNAQGMALGFSSQKIQEHNESGACNIL